MIAAIHQPNFFPWTGYFKKMASSDVFIFLDSVQFPRTSRGTWCNRVRLLITGEARWVTCPILRTGGSNRIAEITIDNTYPWQGKFMRTLHKNYAKAPYFRSLMPWIREMIHKPTNNLSEFNIANVKSIAETLGIKSRLIRHSELPQRDLGERKGSALLATICRLLGADVYLAGDGADDYEDVNEYSRHGITLMRNNFRNPTYSQAGSHIFTPGLSILDSLLNIGPDRTAELLND
jgi:hypothetical protein